MRCPVCGALVPHIVELYSKRPPHQLIWRGCEWCLSWYDMAMHSIGMEFEALMQIVSEGGRLKRRRSRSSIHEMTRKRIGVRKNEQTS